MRMRIAISVTAVLLLTFAESLALVMLYEDMEEEFIASTLDEQLQYSIEHSRQVGSLIKPQTPDMTLYRHALGGPIPEGLPAALAGLPIGNHEDASTGRELHVAIREEDGFRYVLVFDETDHIDREATVATAVAIGGMVMTVLSFILVYALAARLTRGLEALAARVESEADRTPFTRIELDDELFSVACALERAEARQANLIARERDFNANLSHELRTPLAGIRSDAEMLAADASLSDKARRRAERIIAATDRTVALAQSLLLLAREARPAVIEPVNLAATVHEAWARLHLDTERTEPPLLRIHPRAEIDADIGLLRLVLQNLLDNAQRHGEGRAIEVTLEDQRLVVCDRGPGFGADDPTRYFERFQRGSSKPGHGLGLTLVRHVCEASGWKVSASNRPDGGACVSIDFGMAPRQAGKP
ncbi:MAG: HAMP domain-containing histidine kinase [Rhodocyclaceae bacterium]|nr:HAMP domain-containing histidine kinase [Rhodocyclaceae bacterium]